MVYTRGIEPGILNGLPDSCIIEVPERLLDRTPEL